MRHFIFALVLLFPFALSAEEQLLGIEVREAIEGRSLDYGNGDWVLFHKSGEAEYYEGGEVIRRNWQIKGNALCIEDPQSGQSGCFPWVVRKGEMIIFIGGPGHVTYTTYRDAPWIVLNGVEIKEALTERTLKYASATQKFYASGRTLYDAGRPSWGYWRVENDQYCSMWPPSDLWACYRIDRRGEALRFVGERDDITQAEYVAAE